MPKPPAKRNPIARALRSPHLRQKRHGAQGKRYTRKGYRAPRD